MRLLVLAMLLVLPAWALEEVVARVSSSDGTTITLRSVSGNPDWTLDVINEEVVTFDRFSVAHAQRLQEGWTKAKARAYQLKPNQSDDVVDLEPSIGISLSAAVSEAGVHSVTLVFSRDEDVAATVLDLDGELGAEEGGKFEALLLRAQRAP